MKTYCLRVGCLTLGGKISCLPKSTHIALPQVSKDAVCSSSGFHGFSSGLTKGTGSRWWTEELLPCPALLQYLCQLPQHLVVPPSEAALHQCDSAPWQDVLEACVAAAAQRSLGLSQKTLREVSGPYVALTKKLKHACRVVCPPDASTCEGLPLCICSLPALRHSQVVLLVHPCNLLPCNLFHNHGLPLLWLWTRTSPALTTLPMTSSPLPVWPTTSTLLISWSLLEYEIGLLLPVSKAGGFQRKLHCVLAKESQVRKVAGEAEPLPDVSAAIHPVRYWWWNFAVFQCPHYMLVGCELVTPQLTLPWTGCYQSLPGHLPAAFSQPPHLFDGKFDLNSLRRLWIGCSSSHGISSPSVAKNYDVVSHSFPDWKALWRWRFYLHRCPSPQLIKVLQEPCCAWGCL